MWRDWLLCYRDAAYMPLAVQDTTTAVIAASQLGLELRVILPFFSGLEL